MKKTFILLLVTLMLQGNACAEDSALPVFAWHFDSTHHWQLDDNGEATNKGAHTPGEDWICPGCGCEILDWGDGSIDITDYDEYGNVLRRYSFADEELTYKSIHVYAYSEDGLLTEDSEYVNDILCSTTRYAIGAEGEPVPVMQHTWNDDGTTSVNDYDEHGNCIRSAIYEADGALLFETLSEFAQVEDEWFGLWFYECKTTSRFSTGETFYTETNQHGDAIRTLNTYADGSIWADNMYEYEYNDSIKVRSKHYSFGKLVLESSYNDEGSCVQDIEYPEDGGRIVSVFNDQGDITLSTTYAANGSVISTSVYEYVYSPEMDQLEIRVSVDGVLAMETLFHYDEEVGFTGSTETTWHADGSRTVNEYNNWLDLISSTVYAADGSVISTETADEGF